MKIMQMERSKNGKKERNFKGKDIKITREGIK